MTGKPLTAADIGALVTLVGQGRVDDAERRCRALLALHPGAGLLWKVLSVAQLRQGKDGESLAALARAAELLPRDAEAHANLGLTLTRGGRWAAALASLERSLALAPRNPEVLVAAADATRALGRTGQSLRWYAAALEIEPRNIEAQNNLGNALLELRRIEEAAECYRRALDIEPHEARIHCNLGHALQQLGRPQEAAAAYARAADIEPRSADALAHLGAVLFDLRRLDQAAVRLRQALELDPDHVVAHLGLAKVWRQQGRAADALASCRFALEREPRSTEALTLLGELEADGGRFAAAEASLRRAIDLDPGCAAAFCGIAAHRRMTAADTHWLEGVRALLAQGPTRRDEIALSFALGKFFDDVRKYDEAFAHYARANELARRDAAPYDRRAFAGRVDRLRNSFDAPFLRRNREHGSASELPLFIVGMPRSGTTLAEQILAAHPAVVGAGELTFWESAFTAFRQADPATPFEAGPVPALAAGHLARLEALAPGAQRVTDKLPANFLYAGLIHAAFPRARIIHMQRHPLDTCLSIYFQNFFNMGGYSNDLADLAHYYREYLRITAHWRALLPADRWLDVPYEALTAEPDAWTRRLLGFVGLEFDERCLEFHRSDRVVITASKWQVRQPVHTESVQRWRHYEKHLGPLRGLGELETPP